MHRVASTGNTSNSVCAREKKGLTYVLNDSDDTKVLNLIIEDVFKGGIPSVKESLKNFLATPLPRFLLGLCLVVWSLGYVVKVVSWQSDLLPQVDNMLKMTFNLSTSIGKGKGGSFRCKKVHQLMKFDVGTRFDL